MVLSNFFRLAPKNKSWLKLTLRHHHHCHPQFDICYHEKISIQIRDEIIAKKIEKNLRINYDTVNESLRVRLFRCRYDRREYHYDDYLVEPPSHTHRHQ